VVVGTVLLIGVGVAITVILLARGTGSNASPASPTATNSHGATHHSNLPINPTGGKTPTPPATTIQIGTNAQISVAGESGLSVSSAPETVRFTQVNAGSQSALINQMYLNRIAATVTVRETTDSAHVYVLSNATVGGISSGTISQQSGPPQPMTYVDFHAESVQQTS
jgi:hypothetical protein